jgi:hypothetical protein
MMPTMQPGAFIRKIFGPRCVTLNTAWFSSPDALSEATHQEITAAGIAAAGFFNANASSLVDSPAGGEGDLAAA